MLKNIIIIIVAIAVYLHFFPNEQLNEWFEESATKADEKFMDIVDTKARVAPSKIYTSLHKEMKKFSKQEVAYLKEITESREVLKGFYTSSCEEGQENRRLRREHLKMVCDKIDQYRVFRP
ncbi:hypothetical protein [Thalassotalea crassostreae]|uniref:hypothetical protein n=1 Tax=Thalassotalea crassostreae TaxID=1763536 RepID=UPI00083874FE|nr:hypothetical protein [Thalassotalea crassostreae]